MLKKYSMVSSLYPASSLLKHRSASYKRWIHMMLEFPSVNMLASLNLFNNILNYNFGFNDYRFT